MPRKPNPYDINVIFEQMTHDLIASLKRNSLRHKAEEFKEGFRWEQWQSAKLLAMGEYRKRNRAIVNKSMRQAENVVDDVLIQSYGEGEKRFNSLWSRFIRAIFKPYRIYKEIKIKQSTLLGRVVVPRNFEPRKFNVPYHKLPKAPIEEHFFRIDDKKLAALQESVKNDLKKAQHGVLRKMDDVYRQVIYKAEVNMSAGAKTLDQAIDMATKEFLEKGINSIEYSNGRRVSITAYAEMALRTASQRATFLGEGKKRDEWGIYTVVMSSHANCSPMCLPYQGTVMIDDVYTSLSKEDAAKLSKETKFVLLSEAMKNHAFHANCRHTLATFFPGVSSIPAPVDDEKALENYNAEQRQRYMERQIRKFKRLKAGSVDELNQSRYGAKVRKWQGLLRDHLDEHPQLRRDYSREKIYDSETFSSSESYGVLGGTVTSDNIAISKPSKHLVERAVERNISVRDMENALQNPLKVGKVRVDAEGRQSKTYIGESATVAINPETGNVITTYKTSSKRVRRLKDENNIKPGTD